MSRANKALVVMVVSVMGLWGCTQENKKHGNADSRVKALEQKNAKLEDDFRAVVDTRDALRTKLKALDEESARLGKELELLQTVVKERDELRQQVSARSTERDSLQTQLEGLRSGIRTLLGQADKAATASAPQPAISVSKTQAEEKS